MTTWLWPVSHKQRLFGIDSCFCSFRLVMVRDILRFWPLLFLPELNPYGERRLGLVCYVQRPSGSGALSLPPRPHPPNAGCLLPHKGFAGKEDTRCLGRNRVGPPKGSPWRSTEEMTSWFDNRSSSVHFERPSGVSVTSVGSGAGLSIWVQISPLPPTSWVTLSKPLNPDVP